MGDYTKKLGHRSGTQGMQSITVGNSTLYWGTEIADRPRLQRALTPWAEEKCKAASPIYSALVVKIPWSTDLQINLTKTAREIVEDLTGTELRVGGHNPLMVQGRIIDGCTTMVDGVDYAVSLAGIFQRRDISEAVSMLKQVEPRSSFEFDLGSSDPSPIEVIFDGRDVDKAEIIAAFEAPGLPVKIVSASHNSSEDAVAQIVHIVLPFSAVAAVAWATPFGKKVQEKLGEEAAAKMLRGGEALLASIGELALRMRHWRHPLVTIETLVGECRLLFQFKRIPTGPLPAAMIEGLKIAVDEAENFIRCYSERGAPFHSVAYEFSVGKKKWILHTVQTRSGIVLSRTVAAPLAKIVNLATSVGIRE